MPALLTSAWPLFPPFSRCSSTQRCQVPVAGQLQLLCLHLMESHMEMTKLLLKIACRYNNLPSSQPNSAFIFITRFSQHPLLTKKLPHHIFSKNFPFQFHLSDRHTNHIQGQTCKQDVNHFTSSAAMYLITYSQLQEEKKVRLYVGQTKREYNFQELYRTFHKFLQCYGGGKPLHHIAGAKPGARVKIMSVFDAPWAWEGIAACKQERVKGKSVCWGGKKKGKQEKKKRFCLSDRAVQLSANAKEGKALRRHVKPLIQLSVVLVGRK